MTGPIHSPEASDSSQIEDTAQTGVGSLLSSASSASAEPCAGAHPAGSSSRSTTPACVESIDFSYGVIDLLVVVCSGLIGRGAIEPTAVQLDCERYVTLWRGEGREARAVAAEVFLQRLKKIEADKRESVAHLVSPSSLTNRMN
jgi:hypothetical protein